MALLREYLDRTVDRRQTSHLFMSFVKPHGPVTKPTLGRWLKVVLSDCGVDKRCSAHSTRGAATGKAHFANVPIDCIMKAAGWLTESNICQALQEAH